MEGKFCVALLILGLVSTSLAKPKGGHHRHHDGKHHDHDHDHDRDSPKCPELVIADDVPFKCTVTDNCGTYTCTGEFESQSVILSLAIHRSQDPLSADISLKVPGLNFEWSATFKSGDKIQVPGFPLTIKGLGGADMYFVLTMMNDQIRGIAFKLDLILTTNVQEMDVPLIQGTVPLKVEHDNDDRDYRGSHRWGRCSRALYWFKRQSAGVKAAIIISAILAFTLLITGCVICCKKRRVPKGTDMVKVQPPSYNEATSIKTKVPLEPLVNEE